MKRIKHTLVALIALTCSAHAQPGPQVPFDLEKFQPVLSQCRLHSPSTSPATVSAGNFGGYELPGRFYLGADGTTMVLATPTNDRGRSELRHNSGWSFLGPEKRLSARLRFDKPVALGGMRSRLHVLQIYGTGTDKGPTVLVTWVGSWDDSGSEDRLQAYVKGTTTHDLGPRPEGFFDLDVRIEEGILRIFIDDELKVEDDVSNQSYAGGNFFFKTGNYHRGIEAHAVEFDSLSITTAPPAPGLMLEPADGESTTVAQGGDPDAYTVVLNRAPTQDVNVNLTPGNLVTVAPASLTFTNTTWNVPQVVTVSTVDENIQQLLQTETITHATSSLDPDWDELDQDFLVDVVATGYAAPVVDVGPNQTVTMSDSAAWFPTVLSPAGWYDASDAATLALDGSAVSQWRDKSGNNLHLAQSEPSRRPLTGVHTINGLTTVKFDGSNDNMVTSSNPFGSSIQDAFVIAVHRHDGLSQGTLFNLSGTSGTDRWQAHAPWDDHRIYFDAKSGHRLRTAYGVSVGSVRLVGFYGSASESIQQIFRDGNLIASGTDPGTVIPEGNWFVGSGSNTQYQNTSIAEMIVINGTVSTAERQHLEGYLAHKWGRAGSLPASHPYKEAAPGGPGATMTLNATVTTPLGDQVAIAWSWESGPAPVAFANASATSTTAIFTEPGTYVLGFTAFDGLEEAYDEITITVTDTVQETFSEWIAGFDLSERTGFNDDYNHDGVPNGMKYFFGIDPTVPSLGLSALALDMSERNKFSFAHPMGENVPSGIHAEYRWSKDLSTFHTDGISDADGTTVTFVRGAPVDGMVTVTATITGTPTDRIFVTLIVSQND